MMDKPTGRVVALIVLLIAAAAALRGYFPAQVHGPLGGAAGNRAAMMFVIAALPALLAIPMRFWVDDTKEETSEKPISMSEAMKREPLLLEKIVWGSAITVS